MASDPELVARLETVLGRQPGVAPRKMFGGVCFMLNGNMCVGVHHDELIVRVGEAQAGSLLAHDHVRPMDLTGKPMKGWLTIGRAGLTRRTDLERYVRAALSFVKGLPRKSKADRGTTRSRARG